MADNKVGYKKPPREHGFKKGVSGNPLGGKLHDPALKAIKNLTKQEMVDIGNLVVKSDMDGLRRVKDNPKATVLQVMIASVAIKIISKGDMSALDVLLNRLIGKVKDEVIHSGNVETNAPQIVVTLPSNGKEAKDETK